MVRIQFFSKISNYPTNYKSFYKDFFFEKTDLHEFIDLYANGANRNFKKKYSFVYKQQLTREIVSRYLLKYTIVTRGFIIFKRKFYNVDKVLSLNFTRSKFFPTIRTTKGRTYFFLSLGILAKFLQKGKSFTKSKTVYLLLASFLRKILLFGSFKTFYLVINKTPLFFKEIMSVISDPVIKLYEHPFSHYEVNEKEVINPFYFPYVFFQNNKPYGVVKVKKRGRLKRKISKRLTLIGRILD